METEEQLAYLNQFNCDEVQGYLLSRPIPADDFCELIRTDPCFDPGSGRRDISNYA